MDMVSRATLVLALLVASPAGAQPVARWQAHVAEASLRFGIPEAWIWRVMGAESGGRTHVRGRPIRSRKGAMGLMQLMPGTWAEMRRKHGLGNDPDAPRDNILAGTAYLREMYDRFGHPGLFAAYNAGPARYSAWQGQRRPLPGETIRYVATVAGDGSIAAPTSPVVRARPAAEGPPPRAEPGWRVLFVPRSQQALPDPPR